MTTDASAPLSPKLNGQLSFMMFLQYAIWGAWLPILYPFLLGHRGFSMDQCGYILAGGAVGALFGPFIAGQLADRICSTEKLLAASHLLGAVLVWFLAGVTDFKIFMVLSVLYGLIYTPTLSLTNSLAFHHLPNRDRDFGKVRLWGTIGWIAAGIGMGHWLGRMYSPADLTGAALTAVQNAGRADAFKLSAILGAVMSVYCLMLPHTPPAKEARQKSAAFAAISRVRLQPLLTLFLLAIPISIIHQFYFVHTSSFLTELQNRAAAADSTAKFINSFLGVGGGGLMTIGQMAEIAVLAFVPAIVKKMSRKSLLAIGILAYGLRMAIFAYSESMIPILFGVALHGVCFGSFIFIAYMVVDEETPADIRASTQNLFNLIIFGVGIIVGSWFSASIVGAWASAGGKMDYTKLFSVPMWMSFGCLIFLLGVYPGRKRPEAAVAAPSHG